MHDTYDYRVKRNQKLPLKRFRPDDTGHFDSKDEAGAATAANLEWLAELQQVLYAEGRRSLLIVLQGMDTSGKDGTIRQVFSGVNPQGCSVTSFKAPTPAEKAHDFLWRVHLHTPARGMIAIFNRSHYEDVLVPRVHELVGPKVWRQRYEHINAFERLLAEEGTTILKLFLHISLKEQKERLERRLKDPNKNWKFDPQDLKERQRWADYQRAYNDALRHCSTDEAPWYVVPADHKWFRNWLVSDLIVRTLSAMKLRYPSPVEGLDRIEIT